MSESVQVLLKYGYPVLFAFVLAEQVGLPIPAVPVLLAVGALAGTGRMSLAPALGVALFAALVTDIICMNLGGAVAVGFSGFCVESRWNRIRVFAEPRACS
jgi:membrane protein DedA with SNARE-associated domain